MYIVYNNINLKKEKIVTYGICCQYKIIRSMKKKSYYKKY